MFRIGIGGNGLVNECVEFLVEFFQNSQFEIVLFDQGFSLIACCACRSLIHAKLNSEEGVSWNDLLVGTYALICSCYFSIHVFHFIV